MDINRENLDSLFIGFNTQFQAGWADAPRDFAQFSMIVPSSTAIEKYGWLQMLSRMRKWIGPRLVNNIETEVMSLTNLDYEHTIGVPRNDIEDDTLGIYGPLSREMGSDAQYLWQRLAVAAMVANGDWLDGNAFFYDTRVYGANTIDNYVTSALTATTFNAAYLAMMSYLGHDNSPLGVVPNLLVVGPKNRTVAHGILKDQYEVTASGTIGVAATDNPNRGLCDLLVVPELIGTYDDYWYLMDTRRAVKPVAVQKRKEGALIAWDKDSDPCVKDHNRNDYGVHYRGAACLTLPHLCYAGVL